MFNIWEKSDALLWVDKNRIKGVLNIPGAAISESVHVTRK